MLDEPTSEGWQRKITVPSAPNPQQIEHLNPSAHAILHFHTSFITESMTRDSDNRWLLGNQDGRQIVASYRSGDYVMVSVSFKFNTRTSTWYVGNNLACESVCIVFRGQRFLKWAWQALYCCTQLCYKLFVFLLPFKVTFIFADNDHVESSRALHGCGDEPQLKKRVSSKPTLTMIKSRLKKMSFHGMNRNTETDGIF